MMKKNDRDVRGGFGKRPHFFRFFLCTLPLADCESITFPTPGSSSTPLLRACMAPTLLPFCDGCEKGEQLVLTRLKHTADIFRGVLSFSCHGFWCPASLGWLQRCTFFGQQVSLNLETLFFSQSIFRAFLEKLCRCIFVTSQGIQTFSNESLNS